MHGTCVSAVSPLGRIHPSLKQLCSHCHGEKMFSDKGSARNSYGEKCELACRNHSLPLAPTEPQAGRGDDAFLSFLSQGLLMKK